jgi:signal transduction histidine kinase/GAF domain-containing protein
MNPAVDRPETVSHGVNLVSDVFSMRARPPGANNKHISATELLTFNQRLLATLQKINACLLSSHEDLYGDVLDVVRAELQSPFGIFGYVEDDTYLVCPSLTRDVWDRCKMDNKRIAFRLDELGGVLGKVIVGKEVVLTNQPVPTPEGHVAIERFLGAPVIFNDNLIGVIFLANKKEQYTLHDARFIQEVTKYIAPILESRLRSERENRWRQENAKKLEVQSRQLARRNRQLECLAGISELGEKGASTEEILHAAAQMLAYVFSDIPEVCGRIVFRGTIYESGQFEETEHKIAAAIFVNEEYSGGVELCCPAELLEDEGFAMHRLFVSELGERLSSILTRRRLYDDLTAYRQQIELILETTQTGLSILDESGHVMYVDPRRRKIYGEPAGRMAVEYFGDSTPSDCPICDAIRTRQRVSRERNLPKEGNRPVLTTAIPFCMPDGRWYVSEITVDLTERKQWEERLVHMQKLEAVNHLAEGLAHELNTPLQYMESNLYFVSEIWSQLQDLLLSEKEHLRHNTGSESVSPELRRWLEEILEDDIHLEVWRAISETREGLSRMAGIVRALRDLSQIQKQELRTCDLHRVIESALTVARHHWSRVATVTTTFQAGLPLVPLSQADFGQAFINILHNITRAMMAKGMSETISGRIHISTSRTGEDWVEIRIRHNAYGWSEELRKRMFDPFYSQGTPTDPADNGLAFVQRVIVQMHHGMIDLDPADPGESSVVVRLPARSSQESPQNTNEAVQNETLGSEKAVDCSKSSQAESILRSQKVSEAQDRW